MLAKVGRMLTHNSYNMRVIKLTNICELEYYMYVVAFKYDILQCRF